MDNKPFYIKNIIEGKNSVLFNTNENSILYEKLANTLHIGNDGLNKLQDKAESIQYTPYFESESLSNKKNEPLESLVLNVTERCNLACSYCIYSGKYENERKETNSDMDFKTAKKAIDFFVQKSKDPMLISFYGGEPLNNIGLIRKVIEHIRTNYPKKHPIFSMTSNFYNADKFLEEIIKNEIHINISLDGPEEIHNRNRKLKNGNPTYQKLIKNLDKIREMYPKYEGTHFSYNVTCENPDDLPRIINFFQKNEQFVVSRINMVEMKGLIKKEIKTPNLLDLFNFMYNYQTSILSKKDPGILRRFFDQGLKDLSMRSMEAMPERLMLNGSCYPGNRKLFVDTDGQFYMCEKFGSRVSIGDVNKGIQPDQVNQVIKKFLDIRNDYCTNGCWAQRLCNPCIHSSKDPKQDISKEGLEQSCYLNKSQILISLANYAVLSKENRKLFEGYVTQLNKAGR